MIQTAARLSWEAGELMFRTAGSAASLDGRRIQRYWRDLCEFRSNSVHQFDFRSRAVTQARFGVPSTASRGAGRPSPLFRGSHTGVPQRACQSS